MATTLESFLSFFLDCGIIFSSYLLFVTVHFFQMANIYTLLEKHRLERFYKKFLDLGVKDERDFLDGISDEDLNNIGKSR